MKDFLAQLEVGERIDRSRGCSGGWARRLDQAC